MILRLRKIDGVKPWVAKLVGADRRYTFEREFVKATWDGNVATFEMDENPIFVYEVCEANGVTKQNPSGTWRYFCGITLRTREIEKFGIEEAQIRMGHYYRYRNTGRLPNWCRLPIRDDEPFGPPEPEPEMPWERTIREAGERLEMARPAEPQQAEPTPAPAPRRVFLEDDEEDEDMW